MCIFEPSTIPSWGQNTSEKCMGRINQSLQYRKGESCGFTRPGLGKSNQVLSFNTKIQYPQKSILELKNSNTKTGKD